MRNNPQVQTAARGKSEANQAAVVIQSAAITHVHDLDKIHSAVEDSNIYNLDSFGVAFNAFEDKGSNKGVLLKRFRKEAQQLVVVVDRNSLSDEDKAR